MLVPKLQSRRPWGCRSSSVLMRDLAIGSSWTWSDSARPQTRRHPFPAPRRCLEFLPCSLVVWASVWMILCSQGRPTLKPKRLPMLVHPSPSGGWQGCSSLNGRWPCAPSAWVVLLPLASFPLGPLPSSACCGSGPSQPSHHEGLRKNVQDEVHVVLHKSVHGVDQIDQP